MTDPEFAVILRGTKIDGFRRTYHNLPPEHRLAATITEFDDDGVYRCRVMYVRDVEPWVRSEWERVDPVMALD